MATGSVRINGARIWANNRIDFQLNNDETLNNARLIFDIDFDVEFMENDEVVIDAKYYYLLAEYEKTRLNNDTWRYTFSLVDPAIKLQNVFLPNRAIEAGEELLVVFERYMAMYLDKNYVMDSKLRSLLNNLQTTQKTWSKPTLFEVFNDLLRVKNAIITMTDFYTLSCTYLDTRGDDMSHLNIIDNTYNSDYLNNAHILRTDLQNAISDNYVTESLVFTTETEPILNDKNFGLQLQFPVERILELKYGMYFNDGNDTYYNEKDILPMLVEKTVYDSYVASNSLGSITGDGFKRNKVWYKTGSNTLGGFDYDDRSWFPIINVDKPSYDYWGFPAVNINKGIVEGVISVKYIAQMDNITVDMTKNALMTEKKVKYVNQNEPSIDMDNFAIKQRLELERSGALNITIWGEDEPPKLMDYYKDFNIYLIDITIDDVKTTWTAQAKRDYSQYNLNTAISSEKKFTSIEPAEKSFLSNHITSNNFEFSEKPSPVATENIDIVKYLLFRKSIFDSYVLVFIDGFTFILTPLLEKYGNSLVLFYRFKDNYSAGFGFKPNSNTQHEVPYRQRFTSLGFRLYDTDIKQDIFDSFTQPISPGNNDRLISTIKELPALDPIEHGNVFNYITNKEHRYEASELLRYKTDRETTAETHQFNLLSNENVIIWDDYFKEVAWSESKHIFNQDNYIIRVSRDNNRKYSKVDWNFGDGYIDAVSEWIIHDDSFEFNFTHYTGFVIINKFDNKPIMAYNGSNKKLYLVESKMRPKNEYWYISDEFRSVNSYLTETEIELEFANSGLGGNYFIIDVGNNVSYGGAISKEYSVLAELDIAWFNKPTASNFFAIDVDTRMLYSNYPISAVFVETEVEVAYFNVVTNSNFFAIDVGNNVSYGGAISKEYSVLAELDIAWFNKPTASNFFAIDVMAIPNVRDLPVETEYYRALAGLDIGWFNGPRSNFFAIDVINNVIYDETATHKTKYPFVGNLTCRVESGQNRIYADITNNDSMSARIMNNGQTIGVIDAGQTMMLRLGMVFGTGAVFNYSVSAQVDGVKLVSDNTIGSQLITHCAVL